MGMRTVSTSCWPLIFTPSETEALTLWRPGVFLPGNVLGSLQLDCGPTSVDMARPSRQGRGAGGRGWARPGGQELPSPPGAGLWGLLWGWADVASEGLMRSGTLASGTRTGPCGRTHLTNGQAVCVCRGGMGPGQPATPQPAQVLPVQ